MLPRSPPSPPPKTHSAPVIVPEDDNRPPRVRARIMTGYTTQLNRTGAYVPTTFRPCRDQDQALLPPPAPCWLLHTGSRTGMVGICLFGVYTAAKGMTHLVASSLLLGQMFQVSRTPSMSSSCAKSIFAASADRYCQVVCGVPCASRTVSTRLKQVGQSRSGVTEERNGRGAFRLPNNYVDIWKCRQ